MSSTFLNVQKSNSETISANFDGSNIRQIRKIAKPKTKSSKKQKSSKVESLSNSLPTFQRELYAVSNKSTIPGAISQFVNSEKLIYSLEVVQQPVRGRMSGFAIRDFRPITPSPVVKLKAITSSGENVDILNIDDSLFILHADLLARREKIFENAMTVLPFPKYKESLEEYEFKPMDNLIGNHVSSPLKIKDEKGEMGIYFIFSFSVRMAGKYKINFSLIRLGSEGFEQQKSLITDKIDVITETISEEFEIFQVKQFLGNIKTTPLNRAFASQGVRISVHNRGKTQ